MEGILNKHFSLARNIYIYILLALALLLLILFPVYIKEDSASATTGTANSSSTSLTLTTSTTSANVTVTPNSANGTFALSSTNNEAKFSVTNNNYTGYELRIKADDDNGNLVNIDNGNTHTISSIPSSITKSSFDTTTYNNKWGYKPSKYLGPNSTIVTNTGDSALFLPSPTTTGTVLDHTTTPNTTANNYTIALGIRADHNTYAGTYSKTFTLVATANPTTYTINYNKNTTDSVSNMPTTSTAGSTTSTSITLPSTVPTRAHYSFLGWCSTTTTTSNGIDSCSGTVYNPNGAATNLTYGLDQTTANTTTLYAMWKIDTFTLTLTKGSNITDITASPNNTNGVYDYGQTVALTATKTANNTCKSYATPTWTTTAGTLSATSGNSVTITMPASNVTVTATSAESNVSQTITLSKGTGVNGITIDGTKYTGTSASLTCGQHTVTAPAANFNSGYEFSSWAISGSASLSSTSSATTTMTVNGAGTLTLNGKSSKLYLQNVTSATCSTTATTAYDNRDEEAYTIQKLADGKCWLLDNLRLDLTNATVKNNLTASTTNASATTLNYLKNGGGTTSDKYATAGVAIWTGNYNYSAPKIATSGTEDGGWTKDTLQSYGSGSGKIGIYYNFCAVSAGSYCYGNSTSIGSSSGNATEDICPAGWRLPTGGSSGEYRALYTAYSSNITNFKNALRIPLSGYFNNGRYSWGSYSGFWSSTRKDDSEMEALFVAASFVYPNGSGMGRAAANPVRCILK